MVGSGLRLRLWDGQLGEVGARACAGPITKSTPAPAVTISPSSENVWSISRLNRQAHLGTLTACTASFRSARSPIRPRSSRALTPSQTMADPNNSTDPTQASLPPQPPLHSPPPIYTPYYCEENTHNLLRALESGAYTRSRPLRSYAVFVSNLDKRCLLFHQRASKQGAEYGNYVIWDYHVLVVAVMEVGEGRTESVVFDRDSLLGPAVPLRGQSSSPTVVGVDSKSCANYCSCRRLRQAYLSVRCRRRRRWCGPRLAKVSSICHSPPGRPLAPQRRPRSPHLASAVLTPFACPQPVPRGAVGRLFRQLCIRPISHGQSATTLLSRPPIRSRPNSGLSCSGASR